MKITMKPLLASSLSVVGVLAAGAAAYKVNATVLGGTSSGAMVATTTSTQMAPGAQPAVDDVSAAAIGDTPDSTLAPGSGAAATPVSDTTTMYQVGDAGSVVIDTANGSIDVVSVMPAAGWAAEPARTLPDGSVKVHFYGQTARLEFVAAFVDGQVSVTVTSDPIAAPPPPRNRDDDDDRDGGRGDDDGHEEREGGEREDDD